MGFFSTLLGTDGVVDGIKEGIDKSILTPEERLDYHKEMLKAYEPFKLVQRYLALITTALFGAVVIISIVLLILEKPELADAINSLESVGMLGWAYLSIMSLYFSGGVIESFRKK